MCSKSPLRGKGETVRTASVQRTVTPETQKGESLAITQNRRTSELTRRRRVATLERSVHDLAQGQSQIQQAVSALSRVARIVIVLIPS